MKSFLLSLLLILCFGFSTQAVDQLDQSSKIVQDFNTRFEIGFISAAQELLPKVKPQTNPLISFQWPYAFAVAATLVNSFETSFTANKHSNFITSGASLIYDLSRSHS